VAATLVHRAVGDRLTCVFVTTGCCGRRGRAGEETFRRTSAWTWSTSMRRPLPRGPGRITEPEAQRRVIGETFIRVFEEVAAPMADARFLVQGTSTPTSSSRALATPPASRATTTWAGSPPTCAWSWWSRCATCSRTRCGPSGRSWAARGDGLASALPRAGAGGAHHREVTFERLEILRAADAIITEEVRRAGLYRSCGSLRGAAGGPLGGGAGHERTYAYPLVVRRSPATTP